MVESYNMASREYLTFYVDDLASLIYESYNPSIYRPSMWIIGGIVHKAFLTALLEYFNASDCSIRVFRLF